MCVKAEPRIRGWREKVATKERKDRKGGRPDRGSADSRGLAEMNAAARGRKEHKPGWFRVTSGCLSRQRRKLRVGVRIAKTACRVLCGRDQQPRVARSSQLWASSWAPFGMPPELAGCSRRPAESGE
jgi:hypothetical protein